MSAYLTVRYWAAARDAAGVETDQIPVHELPAGAAAATVAHVLSAAVHRRPALDPVVAVSSVLVDGLAVARDHVLSPGSVLEVLPPFAGG